MVTAAAALMVWAFLAQAMAISSIDVDDAKKDVGVVGTEVESNNDKLLNKLKVKIFKEVDEKNYYTYNLLVNAKESFPLQMLNGRYVHNVLQHVSGNSFKVLEKTTIVAEMKDPDAVFLQSIQMIKWTDKSKAVIKAKDLVKNKKTQEEKVKAIYNFVISNITYHTEVKDMLPGDYLPDIDKVLAAKKGICYDYSSLFAAMLRSQGIPAKLIMGYASWAEGEFHAWNEVLLDGEWIVVDTTYDAAAKAAKKPYDMAKNPKMYKGTRLY